MSKLAGRLILSSSLVALGACAATPPPVPPAAVVEAVPPAPAEPKMSAHDRLFKLFKDSDEASLKRNPLNAIFRGDMRYADHFGDYITDEYYAHERAASESDLAELHAIPRDQLTSTDQLAY